MAAPAVVRAYLGAKFAKRHQLDLESPRGNS